MIPLLQISQIAKRFGATEALRGASFSLEAGEILGLLGPNGSGKSTLLRVLCGLVKGDAGSIVWKGEAIEYPNVKVRERSGVLIERPPFFPYLSADENLELSGRYSGIALSKARRAALLETVGLPAGRKSAVSTFSMGMKQRLGIAMAILNEPEFLILDEPFNGMDPIGVRDMRRLLLGLCRERGLTILLSSHQLHEIESLCDRVAIMHEGKVRKEGTLHEVHEGLVCRYALECSSSERAATALSEERLERRSSRELAIWVEQARAPELLQRLVAAGVSVYRFAPERRLEDLFADLQKTGGED